MGVKIGGAEAPKISDINIPAHTGETVATPPPKQPQTDSQTEARHAQTSKQYGNDNRPQNDVRSSYVQRKLEEAYRNTLPKVPDPSKYVPKDGVKTKDNSPSTTFTPSKPAIVERASGRMEYEKLPEDLKSKLNHHVWGHLGEHQRHQLAETYNRMKDYGVWDDVKRVIGEKNPPEPNAKIGGKEVKVAGNSGGILFEAKDGDVLQKKLIATKHFGKDGNIMGSQHKGHKSNREWTANDERGMHISIGKNNIFDVHIDKYSPVKEPVHGKTQVDIGRAKKHGQYELIPEKIRKNTRAPGIIVDGSIEQNRKGWHGGELKIGVKFEFHGPVKKKVPLQKTGPDSANPAPKEMLEKISKRVDRAHIHFPTPIGSNPDEVPDAQAMATRMAAEMMEAARNGKMSIQMNIPQYLNKTQDHAAVGAAMQQIGEIIRREMIAADPKLNSVRGLKITFGSMNQSKIVGLAKD